MKITPAYPSHDERSAGTAIDGPLWIDLDLFADERGFFVERFHADKFRTAGFDIQFVQDNHSRSAPGVLRGLHFQRNPVQGKLVSALAGHIFDVIVDLRKRSPTFGKWFSQELGERPKESPSARTARMLWVPPGFAHGFCVLGSTPAEVLYKVDGVYNANTDGGIRFDDPTLQIPWPIKTPIVSAKDRALPTLDRALPF